MVISQPNRNLVEEVSILTKETGLSAEEVSILTKETGLSAEEVSILTKESEYFDKRK